jgi:hypothetical protein
MMCMMDSLIEVVQDADSMPRPAEAHDASAHSALLPKTLKDLFLFLDRLW